MSPSENQTGQAWLEFLLGTALLTITIVGSAWTLKISWERHRCLQLVFETTRKSLESEGRPPGISRVVVTRSPGEVQGSISCPPLAMTPVTLRKLGWEAKTVH